MCCVKYNLCSDTGSWGLHGVANSMIDSMCTGDFVEINGVSGECVMGSGGELHSKLCGNAFNVVTGQAAANLPSVCGEDKLKKFLKQNSQFFYQFQIAQPLSKSIS